MALRIQMTAMPQMVALLNGFGGGASALVAGAALADVFGHTPTTTLLVATGLGADRRRDVLGQHRRVRQAPGAVPAGRPIMLPAQQLVTALVGARRAGR
jgi:H+-translocating NAD(P) transhydrogenase subunit beta